MNTKMRSRTGARGIAETRDMRSKDKTNHRVRSTSVVQRSHIEGYDVRSTSPSFATLDVFQLVILPVMTK